MARKNEYRGRAGTSPTLGEYLAEWIEDHGQVVRPGTASAYRSRAQAILEHPFAGKRLRSLDESHFRRLIADVHTGSHSTVMAKVQLLMTALNAAVRAGLLSENKLAGIKVSRVDPKFQAQAWDVDTALRFLANRREAGDPLYVVWHLALATGMRKGELHGLQRADIDLDRRVLHVRRQRTQVRGKVHETAPKTAASEAPIFLDEGTVDLLRRHTWVSEYLVTDPKTGRPFTHMQVFHNAWKKACREAGVPAIRFHDLRHTSASFLAATGVPLILAKERMRHWSTSMTARYQHALDSMGPTVADQIGALLTPVEEDDPAA